MAKKNDFRKSPFFIEYMKKLVETKTKTDSESKAIRYIVYGRPTPILPEELVNKIQMIADFRGVLMGDVVSNAVKKEIKSFERKHGELVVPE
ncbi:MAG: hypothetical protein Q8Q51_11585 [Lutibacter sp.]|nr:hypothetical protein [Lutibacter sp.]